MQICGIGAMRALGLAVAALGVTLGVLATPACAENYPARPVTIIVPFAPGSVTDAAARLIGQHLQDALGQPFVIENKAGAGGLIAASAVAHAAPDGYTLLITTNSTHSAAPALFKNVPYDPIKDFTPVARIGSFPSMIAVYPGLPIKTIGELVAYAKANPGKLEYGHGNSTGQIVGETLKKRTGVDIVRVAYRSNPPAVADLIAGHIAMMIPDFNTGLPQVKAGLIRPVAVFTKERNPRLPDVPTLNETVMPGFDILSWAGMFAPANAPPDVVARLANALQTILSDPKIVEHFAEIGTDTFYSGPREFGDYVQTELVKWTTVAKEAGIEPE
jgi:tripartite-type tricarboxylate transporter receptor subunit TctC